MYRNVREVPNPADAAGSEFGQQWPYRRVADSSQSEALSTHYRTYGCSRHAHHGSHADRPEIMLKMLMEFPRYSGHFR
jgi:hypothetical protein